MIQVLIGFLATLRMLALSVIVPLLVGVAILLVVQFVPLVGRRGLAFPRTARDSTKPPA